MKLKIEPEIQKHVFTDNDGVFALVTMESLVNDGIPLNDNDGEMDYMGAVTTELPCGYYGNLIV